MRSVLVGTYQPPLVDGLVIWGDSDGDKESHNMIPFFHDVEGPMVDAYLADLCTCADTHCSAHGVCVPQVPRHAAARVARRSSLMRPPLQNGSAPQSCSCFSGFSGSSCDEGERRQLEAWSQLAR